MHVVLLLDGTALTVRGSDEFGSQRLRHGALFAARGVGDQPANRERGAAVGADLVGTWYVAPPTRRAFTSSIGRALKRALRKNVDAVLLGPLLDVDWQYRG